MKVVYLVIISLMKQRIESADTHTHDKYLQYTHDKNWQSTDTYTHDRIGRPQTHAHTTELVVHTHTHDNNL